MNSRVIYEWLCASPLLADEKLNLDYLPTYEGWSMTMPRRRTDTDINADRLAIADELDNLRFWAKQNPPDGCRVILAGMSKPKSKSASGTEDFILTLKLEEF